MEDLSKLLEMVRPIGRYAGACTTFERAAAQWRDSGEAYVGVRLENLAKFAEGALAPEFMKWLHHPDEKVRTLAQAAIKVAQHPLDRSLLWKLRDLYASSGERAVPVPYSLVYNLVLARSALS